MHTLMYLVLKTGLIPIFGAVAVCSSSMQETAVHLKAKGGGVTHMLFSPNSTLLYTGSRKVSSKAIPKSPFPIPTTAVQCWDLRIRFPFPIPTVAVQIGAVLGSQANQPAAVHNAERGHHQPKNIL